MTKYGGKRERLAREVEREGMNKVWKGRGGELSEGGKGREGNRQTSS